MWAEITRPKYDHEKLRYASDLTDDAGQSRFKSYRLECA